MSAGCAWEKAYLYTCIIKESYEMVGSVWMSNNLSFEEHIVLIPRYKAILDFNVRSVFAPGSI